MLTTNSIRSNNKKRRKRTMLGKSVSNSLKKKSEQNNVDSHGRTLSSLSEQSTVCSSLYTSMNDRSSRGTLAASNCSSTSGSQPSSTKELLSLSDDDRDDECGPWKNEVLHLPPTTTTTTTTVAAATTTAVGQTTSFQRQQMQLVQASAALSITSVVCFAVMLVQVLPFTVVLSGTALSSSLGMLLYTVWSRMLLEYQAVIRKNGLEEFLPETLWDKLTTTSLQDVLFPVAEDTDGGVFNEWVIILALYFMPGLSKTQRASFISQLSPRHLQLLSRKGLGNLLGDQFMLALLGEKRYWQRVMNIEDKEGGAYAAGIISSTSENTAVVVKRRKENNIGLDLLEDEDDEEYPNTATIASVPESHETTNNNNNNNIYPQTQQCKVNKEEEEDNEKSNDQKIVEEAVKEAAKGCVNMQMTIMTKLLGPKLMTWFVEPATGFTVYLGLATSMISTSIGLLQHVWLPRNSTSTPASSSSMMLSSWCQSHNAWMYMATLGGLSAGLSLGTRFVLGQFLRCPCSLLPPPPFQYDQNHPRRTTTTSKRRTVQRPSRR